MSDILKSIKNSEQLIEKTQKNIEMIKIILNQIKIKINKENEQAVVIEQRKDNIQSKNLPKPQIEQKEKDSYEDLWNKRRQIHSQLNLENNKELSEQNTEKEKKIEFNLHPLLRLNKFKREELTYKFFMKAKENLKYMGVTEKCKDFDAKRNAETDRLLEEWSLHQYKK